MEALYSRNAKILGIIFNGVDPKQPEYGYYKYTEYYYSKTVSRKKPADGEGQETGTESPRMAEVSGPAADSKPIPPPPVPNVTGKS